MIEARALTPDGRNKFGKDNTFAPMREAAR
jgi:hypothetical protein